MKVLFCGLGSIGQKHLRNLLAILDEEGIDCTVDALRSSDRQLPDDIAAALSATYTGATQLPGGYDIAFVTNPSSLHAQTIHDLKGRATNLYIEKPLFTDTDADLERLGLCGDGVYYVACPLRHHPVIRRVKELVRQNRPAAARAICSSSLPDWRPAADYRAVYSAKRELGGGVPLDLIHEWDYLCWLFGLPLEVTGFAGKLSALDIDSDDIAVYAASFGDLLLTLHLDYIGRPPLRQLELFGDDGTIRADLLTGTVTLPDGTAEVYAPEDIHLLDLRYFIECVLEGRADNMNTPAHALDVLEAALSVQEVQA